jgi:hypothetical protein
VFDTSSNSWAEWGTWDGSHEFTEFIGSVAVYSKAWDITFIGDRTNGKIYKLDNENFQDNGSNVHTLIRTAHIDHGTSNKKRSKKLRIKVKKGVGGLVTNPEFTIRWRDKNGAWSNTVAHQLGRAGDEGFWIEMSPMGIYEERQYEIRHADNSNFILMDMEEDVEILPR